MSAVSEIVDKIADGSMTVDDATARLRDVLDKSPGGQQTYTEIETNPDPDPLPENSFGEIELAYADGRLTDEQYGQLVQSLAS